MFENSKEWIKALDQKNIVQTTLRQFITILYLTPNDPRFMLTERPYLIGTDAITLDSKTWACKYCKDSIWYFVPLIKVKNVRIHVYTPACTWEYDKTNEVICLKSKYTSFLEDLEKVHSNVCPKNQTPEKPKT